MGGCASTPKDLDLGSEPVPVEAPVSPKKPEAEAETVPQENNVEEKKEEEPLIDISEPAKESPKVEESKTTEAEVVPELIKPSEKEEVKPADSTEVTAPTVKIAEALKEPAEEKPEVEVVTPRSVDKSDAPLVSV